ncbi:hypothetical protein D3C76_1410360 [compost metagenome]
MHQGAGPGLTPRTVGEQTGSGTVTLLQSEIPAHTHIPQAVNATGSTGTAAGNYWAQSPKVGRPGSQTQAPLFDSQVNVPMNPQALNIAGGSQPHNNMQPYLTQTFIICLNGEFPSRG